MDQTTPMGGTLTGSRANPNANPIGPKAEDAVQAAHQTTDKIADKATAQVDRLSGTAHRAVNSAADAAASAAEWASAIRWSCCPRDWPIPPFSRDGCSRRN